MIFNLPDQAYENGEKYCLLLGQDLPTATTIVAPVVCTIGESTTQFPVVNSNCTQATACEFNSRTRYSTVVHTGIQSGVFQLTGPLSCSRRADYPDALVATVATTATSTGGEDSGDTKTTD